jgi:hypothetical protein
VIKIFSLGIPEALIASPTSFSDQEKKFTINIRQITAGNIYCIPVHTVLTILIDQRAVQMPISALQRVEDGFAHFAGLCLPCA